MQCVCQVRTVVFTRQTAYRMQNEEIIGRNSSNFRKTIEKTLIFKIFNCIQNYNF